MKDSMKALIFPKPWEVKCIDVDIPKPKTHEVLTEMRSVGICGSDVGIFEGNHWIVAHGPGGHGHETGAIVREVGSEVSGIHVGDHVARMGAGYAEYSTHVNVIGHGKDELSGALPIVRNDLSMDEISFADAVGCAINCFERAEFDKINDDNKKAIVFGLGPIGLILTKILLNHGIEVAVSEPFAHKRQIAQEWGAKTFDPHAYSRPHHGNYHVMDAIKEEFGEAHGVFEMVGKKETLLDAINLVYSGFRVMVFGAQKLMQIPYVDCRKKGVELVYPEAMVNSKANKDYWGEALDLIASHTLDLDKLITKRISLEDAIEAFQFYDRQKWIKIIVEPFRN
ncbi:L-threonine 3-dehydrogenase [Candidatus Lokiarchaeum ossiferum]|uniref:L-threonine 3-dehydrogenase n=1 Tax=Candidatus Lokiarchaeum ossiferum TaxID=2951803 RepID=A0ABY6HKD4_9ARCH|nr:L-threonine 3-dehydrogenase [Candidatus Lokiarchaeum sp. B-35]